MTKQKMRWVRIWVNNEKKRIIVGENQGSLLPIASFCFPVYFFCSTSLADTTFLTGDDDLTFKREGEKNRADSM